MQAVVAAESQKQQELTQMRSEIVQRNKRIEDLEREAGILSNPSVE